MSNTANVARPFSPTSLKAVTESARMTRRSAPQALELANVRRLQARECLFCEGEKRTHVFEVLAGIAAIYQSLPDGRRQIFDFSQVGDYIGLGTTPEHLFGAEATTPLVVRALSARALEDKARRDPGIALQLYRTVSLELAAARQLLVSVGQRSAIERLASFLVVLIEKAGEVMDDGMTVHLPMRRADIGDHLGLTIETISRTFTKLRHLGVIDIRDETIVRVNDLAMLMAISRSESSRGIAARSARNSAS